MKQLIFYLLVSTCFFSLAQKLQEKLIITDNGDSTLLKYETKYSFDKEGNHVIVFEKNEKEYFLTKKDTIGPFSEISSWRDITYAKEQKNQFVFKNSKGTTFYTIKKGTYEDSHPSERYSSVVITMKEEDSLAYYGNGNFLFKTKYQKYGTRIKDLVQIISENQFAYLSKDKHQIIINDSVVVRSEKEISSYQLNKNKDYTYTTGRKPIEGDDEKYNYLFFIHTSDSVFGPVRTTWTKKILDNGAYYYTSDDAGTYYILINDILYKGFNDVHHIQLIDEKNSMFFYRKNDEKGVNVNGKIYLHNYDKVYHPILDTNGNFAFYGERDYFLYKFVNGKEDPIPISKYGVRPIPIYINTKGESTHLFITDDSCYYYQGEKLFHKPFSNRKVHEILSDNESNNPSQNIMYLKADTMRYILWKGNLSKPIVSLHQLKSKRKKYFNQTIINECSENHFFMIYQVEKNKYKLLIDNQIYIDLEGVNKILSENYFFDDKSFIFYGMKGKSIYQFTITL